MARGGLRYARPGPVAQWSEQRTHNPSRPGSNPGGPIQTHMPSGLPLRQAGQVCRGCLGSTCGAYVGAYMATVPCGLRSGGGPKVPSRGRHHQSALVRRCGQQHGRCCPPRSIPRMSSSSASRMMQSAKVSCRTARKSSDRVCPSVSWSSEIRFNSASRSTRGMRPVRFSSRRR